MPHEEQREKNIQLVTEKALDCFLENGIEKTKIADIARQCGLAERSVFRYFETKADLVLAASLLYWNRVLERIDQNVSGGQSRNQHNRLGGCGKDSCLLFQALPAGPPKGCAFYPLMQSLPATMQEGSTRSRTSPLSPLKPPTALWPSAIRKGLADGSISPDVDAGELLQLLRRDPGNHAPSIGGTPSARELDYDSRMLHLSQMFVRALSAKIIPYIFKS